MHATISQQHFDDLQAPASIDADTLLEDVSSYVGAAADQTKSSRKHDTELAVLFGMFANTSRLPSKGAARTSMPVAHAAELPPPVRFNRTNRQAAESGRAIVLKLADI